VLHLLIELVLLNIEICLELVSWLLVI